jgi:GTP-binding protein YchF
MRQLFHAPVPEWDLQGLHYNDAMLQAGIVGLPNVGKSTLFNALTAGHAEVSNYPFTTIDSNIGMVQVPDPRLDELSRLLKPIKTTPCCIRFLDIAGLVRGASQGEGLGNQFLGEIRQVDALVHVARCFSKADVAHVFADVDPLRDAEVVETELLLADLEVLNRAIAKREKTWQTHPQEHAAERTRMLGYRTSLEQGRPLRDQALSPEEQLDLKTAGLLSGKPLLFVANCSDASDTVVTDRLRARFPGAEAITIVADLEWELAQIEEGERLELMRDLGMSEPGLHHVVRACFRLLGLVSFFTIAKSKLQAWEVPRKTPAQQAAGKVHTDMERGFIRAHVASWQELCAAGSLSALQRQGLLRTVGKDYEIQDGDVVEFLFNV